jgi:thiamine transporter ThiT
MIRTAITEILQDMAIILALYLILNLVGYHPNIWQCLIIVGFTVLISCVHYRRGLKYGLSYVVTSFVKENIDK